MEEKEEEEGQEEKSEIQKKDLVEKVQRKGSKFFSQRRGKKRKKSRLSDRRPGTRQVLEKSGRLLFLLVLLVQNWLCVNAAAEGLQKSTEVMERVQ